jgi:CPA2 family monovalent cation:H+ antiporter-2
VAESGEGTTVEHLIAPIRDIFGAVFFVSVGMLIEPHLLVLHWPAVVVISAVIVGGKIAAVSGASLAIGEPPSVAIKTGFALAQIGEFSFIMAEVGHANGATRDFLYSLAVAVSTITAFLTPFLIRVSKPAAQSLGHIIPRPVAGVVTHYVGWMGRIRGRQRIQEK